MMTGMSRWLERRSAWQYFLILSVFTAATTILVIAAITTWYLHRSLHLEDVGGIAFVSLGGPIGATMGRQQRKDRRRAR
jgi:hypothetical protein